MRRFSRNFGSHKLLDPYGTVQACTGSRRHVINDGGSYSGVGITVLNYGMLPVAYLQ
jgi:hypothetical protein